MSNVKERKIAVTGATGMVGSHLVAYLLLNGYSDITLIVRNLESLERLYRTLDREDAPRGGITVIESALNNPQTLLAALNGIDTVFNCAAKVSFSDDQSMISTNVEMTAHVVNAALESGVSTLVHVSSISVLGAMGGDCPLTELNRLEDIAGQSAYARSKFLSDNQAFRGREMGLNTIIVMPAVILGEGEWRGGGSAAMIPLISSGIPFHTHGVTGYVDVRDVVRAMVMLSEESKAANEDFILCAENLSFRDLIGMGAAAAQRRKPFIRAGRFMLRLAQGVGGVVARIAPSRKVPLTKEAVRSAQSVNRYDGSKVGFFITFGYSTLNKTVDRVVKRYILEKR